MLERRRGVQGDPRPTDDRQQVAEDGCALGGVSVDTGEPWIPHKTFVLCISNWSLVVGGCLTSNSVKLVDRSQ